MALIGAKPVSTGDQYQRLARVFAQEEAAMWPVDAHDVAFLHRRKDVAGVEAARYMANVKLQKGVIVRGVGQRKCAPPAVLEQDLDVLPGEELQPFAGRQLEFDDHDVGSRPRHFLHASRQRFDWQIPRRANVTHLDRQIAFRLGAAK